MAKISSLGGRFLRCNNKKNAFHEIDAESFIIKIPRALQYQVHLRNRVDHRILSPNLEAPLPSLPHIVIDGTGSFINITGDVSPAIKVEKKEMDEANLNPVVPVSKAFKEDPPFVMLPDTTTKVQVSRNVYRKTQGQSFKLGIVWILVLGMLIWALVFPPLSKFSFSLDATAFTTAAPIYHQDFGIAATKTD